MNKNQKRDLSAGLVQEYGDIGWVFLINYGGLDAFSTLALRKDLRSVDAKMSVVKNKINKVALEQTKFAGLSSALKSQIAVVYGNDPVSISKVINKYFTEGKKVSPIASSDGNNFYDTDAIKKLASLPTVDVLRAKLLGTLNSPASTLLRLMKDSPASLVRVLNAHSENGK